MSRQQINDKPATRRNKRQKNIRRWHRWVGYSSIFLVLILSITGLILNRAEKLGLNQIMIDNDFISSLYGLSPDTDPVHFKVNNHWMSWLEGRVYLDGRLIAQNSDRLVGGAVLDGLFVIGTEDRLSLYLKDGSLIEVMDSSSLPGKIIALGQWEKDNLLLITPDGAYGTADDFISWQKISSPPSFLASSPASAQAGPSPQVPAQITEKILLDFRGQGISLSRIILDLHSGHIMGSLGPYLMDLAAISLIFLSITGLMKRRRSEKDRHKKK